MTASEYYQQWAMEHAPDSSKTVEELTNDERMAVFILAGVPIVRIDENTIRTGVMCGMVKDGDKFRIFQDDRPMHGTRVLFRHHTGS